jgi:glycosyltransferase involved in cell wall biosynthesis
MSNLKISVVTVVKNDSPGFEKTAQSILGQDYPALEWIVIDGGSTDGTVEEIRKYENRISYWFSESDLGPYDAMNKGLSKATGEWIIFLNAGDLFYANKTLTGIFNSSMNDADIVFGDAIADYRTFKVYQKAGRPRDLWKGMICRHQSLVIRTNLIKKMKFDLAFKYGADYAMVFQLFSHGSRFKYFPMPISIYDTRGISNRNMFKSVRDHYIFLKQFRGLTIKERIYYYNRMAFMLLIMSAYIIIPPKQMDSIIKWINRKQIP